MRASSSARRASSLSAISSPMRCSARMQPMRADALGLDAGGECRLGEIDEAAEQPHHRGLARRAADAVDLRERRLAQEGLAHELGAEQRQLLRAGSASLPMMRAMRSSWACSSSSVRKRRRNASHRPLPCAAHHGANSRASSA